MPEGSGIQSILDAATRAAGSSDWPTADKCLRLALRMQEASLGAAHPDLAQTLNNLAVVCEVTQRIDEAEVCFRKALTIVAAALPADHPSVATARENLRQFCAAHDIPLDLPPDDVEHDRDVAEPEPPPVLIRAEVPTAAPTPAPAEPRLSAEAPPLLPLPLQAPEQLPRARHVPPPSTPPWRRPIAIAGMIAVVVILAVVAARSWRDTDRPSAAAMPAASSGDAAPPRPAAKSPKRTAPASAPKPKPPAPKPTPPAASSRDVTTRTTRTPALTVVDAQVCARLSTSGGAWTCTPAGNPARAGQLTFYTRIASPADTDVEHRWYRNGELRQSSELQIRANPRAGYRTYSRHTITAAGDWRVELRAADGTILREERFIVR